MARKRNIRLWDKLLEVYLDPENANIPHRQKMIRAGVAPDKAAGYYRLVKNPDFQKMVSRCKILLDKAYNALERLLDSDKPPLDAVLAVIYHYGKVDMRPPKQPSVAFQQNFQTNVQTNPAPLPPPQEIRAMTIDELKELEQRIINGEFREVKELPPPREE